MDRIRLFGLVFGLIAGSVLGADLNLDERGAVGGEWGYRPGDGDVSAVNPPSFSWRPVNGMAWEVQCARDTGFGDAVYRVGAVGFNVHCPPRVFEPGTYYWRYRGTDSKGQVTNWSVARKFTIGTDAVKMPMPVREELLGRIPKSHPRLFVRPENVGKLKAAAAGPMKEQFQELVRECEKRMARPVSTVEPETYPKDIVPNSDPWREMVGQPHEGDRYAQWSRYAGIHASAGRQGRLWTGSKADSAGMCKVEPQGQHRLSL
jgi:hypothetical protein